MRTPDTAMQPSVLVIDGDCGGRERLRCGLRAEGFVVDAEGDGEAGMIAAVQGDHDLVVLSAELSGRTGLEVLAGLRTARPRLPVILSSAAGDTTDRVRGLDAGAVDYMVAPVSVTELAARIRAQLRAARAAGTTSLRSGGIEVDLLSRRVTYDGEPVHLSPTEYRLLVHLIERPGIAVSRPELLRDLWGYQHDPATNVVDVYVGYLRRKLKRAGRECPIATVRSVGYRFAPERAESPHDALGLVSAA